MTNLVCPVLTELLWLGNRINTVSMATGNVGIDQKTRDLAKLLSELLGITPLLVCKDKWKINFICLR